MAKLSHETKIEIITFGGIAAFAAWLWYAWHQANTIPASAAIGDPLSTGGGDSSVPPAATFNVPALQGGTLPTIAPDVINLGAPINATSYGTPGVGSCGCPAPAQQPQYSTLQVLIDSLAPAVAAAGFASTPAGYASAYQQAEAHAGLTAAEVTNAQIMAGTAASGIINGVPWD